MNIPKEKLLAALLLILFIGIRLWGVDLPYHQDEQKYVARGVLLQGVGVTSGHPPLLGLIITAAGFIFGDAFFRLMPLLFGTGSLVMLYILMRVLFSARAALWAGFLYALSPYGVWSSLMIDVDGAVLPFFAFSAFLFYVLWHEHPTRRRLYGILCVVSLLLGALVKLSFVLVFAALGADMAIRYWRKGDHRAFYLAGIGIVLLPLLILGFIALLSAALPAFDFVILLNHVQDYLRFSGRNYAQVVYQTFKALLYLSPLLVAPLFFISRPVFERLRVFVLYLGFAFIFYFILFDFSSGALDKYLMVSIMPLAALSGGVLARQNFNGQNLSGLAEVPEKRFSRRWLVIGIVVAVLLIIVQALPHAMPPLYPKEEWLARVFKFQWNFLVPFMGGSGPTGFYASWLFMAVAWIVAVGAALWGVIRTNRASVRPGILIVGVTYAVIMLSEMLFGYPHGSSKKVLNDALQYIERMPSVQSVITFNDTGGYYLKKMGKYKRRMYAVPKYEELYKEVLNAHNDHLLVVNIPRIYEESVYWRYISSCRPEFVSRSGYISATLYDCASHVKL